MPFSFEENLVRAMFEFLSHASFLKPIAVFFGSVAPFIVVIWFLVAIIAARSFKLKFYYFSLAALGAIISRGVITEAIQTFFYAARPFERFGSDPIIAHAINSGMPSGHMAFLVPIALAFMAMGKKEGIIAFIAVIITGIARVALGAHWFSDIAAGITVGIVGFFAAKALLPKKLSAAVTDENTEGTGNDRE